MLIIQKRISNLIFPIFAGTFLILSISPLSGQSQGESLFKVHCGSCHTISPPPEKAPPVYGIAMHYRRKYSSKSEFVAAIVDYAKSPDPAKSIMPNARAEFGNMAPIQLPDSELIKIAAFIHTFAQKPGGGRRFP